MNEVPWLRSGTGKTPADGGCIMQVVDWIHREEWTDAPPCVHPVIRYLAITLNDRLDDEERQKLLDLAPRMMNTAGGDEALTRKLLGHLARRVYPIYEQYVAESGYDDRGSVLACIEAAESGEAADAAWAADAARAARAARVAEAANAAWAADAARAAWAADAARAANAAWAARAANAAWAAWADNQIDLLVGLLDKYDELTGRKQSENMDFSPVCEALSKEFVRAI